MAPWYSRLFGSAPAAPPIQPPEMKGPGSGRVEQKVLGLNDTLGKFFLLGAEGLASTPASAFHLYEQSTAVSIPVNMIADAFATLEPVVLVKGTDGQDRLERDHPVLDLLRKPGERYSLELLLETLAKAYLVAGECFLVGLGGVNRPPLALVPIDPKSLTPSRGSGTDAPETWHVAGNTLSGLYTRGTGVRDAGRFFGGSLREFWQIRNYSTRDNGMLRGLSPLVSASREARQHVLGSQHNVSLLERGGRVSLVFHFRQDMDEDDFEETKNRVREQYGGASKAGEIGVTAGGELDIKEAGVNNRDMDFANLQKLAMKSVALAYHVPLPLVSDERMTMGNYAEAKTALYDDAVIPLAGRIFGGLSDALLPRFGVDPRRMRITFDPDLVPTLLSRRNEQLKLRKDIGLETDNELRAMIGREPYAGGDVHYKPSSSIPVGQDIFTDDNAPDVVEDPAVKGS
jgi:phage portal protein BeeE